MLRHCFDVAIFKRCSPSFLKLISQLCCCDIAALDDGHNLTAGVVYDVATTVAKIHSSYNSFLISEIQKNCLEELMTLNHKQQQQQPLVTFCKAF